MKDRYAPHIGDVVGPGLGEGGLVSDSVRSIDANTFMEVFSITPLIEAAKMVVLTVEPTTIEDVVVTFYSGSAQEYGIDFVIENGIELKWNGLGMDLDGIAIAGEKFFVQYVV